jgi:murein tripeptide amidase MpaA
MISTDKRQEIMDRFVDMHGSLDGHRAVIKGKLLDFPIVWCLNGIDQAEFSWYTLEKAVSTGNVHLKTGKPIVKLFS